MAYTNLQIKFDSHPEPDVAWTERLRVDRNEANLLTYNLQDKEYTEHYVLKLALEQNYLSPIVQQLKKGIHVLEIGCSSVQWVLDMANEYPQSTFIGIDKAPVYAKEYPDNVKIIQGDILNGLTFKDSSFDFIFQRNMMICYQSENWDFVVREVKRILKPGGYAEFSERTLDIYRSGEISTTLCEALKKSVIAAGSDFSIGLNLPDYCMSADFTHVRSKCVSIPLGWSGPVGELFKENMLLSFQILSSLVVDTIGMTNGEYSELLNRASKEWARNRSWVNWYVVYVEKAKQ